MVDIYAERAEETIESLQEQIKRVEKSLRGGRTGRRTPEAALTLNKELSALYKQLNETLKVELADYATEYAAASAPEKAELKIKQI